MHPCDRAEYTMPSHQRSQGALQTLNNESPQHSKMWHLNTRWVTEAELWGLGGKQRVSDGRAHFHTCGALTLRKNPFSLSKYTLT